MASLCLSSLLSPTLRCVQARPIDPWVARPPAAAHVRLQSDQGGVWVSARLNSLLYCPFSTSQLFLCSGTLPLLSSLLIHSASFSSVLRRIASTSANPSFVETRYWGLVTQVESLLTSMTRKVCLWDTVATKIFRIVSPPLQARLHFWDPVAANVSKTVSPGMWGAWPTWCHLEGQQVGQWPSNSRWETTDSALTYASIGMTGFFHVALQQRSNTEPPPWTQRCRLYAHSQRVVHHFGHVHRYCCQHGRSSSWATKRRTAPSTTGSISQSMR